MKLTKRVVDDAKVQSSDFILWDDRLPGFGLRVFPSGKRSYLYQYRQHGRTRRYTIGPHGKWTPDQAWRKAMELCSMVNGGRDPSQERRSVSLDMTVAELCDLYLREGCSHKKSSTVETDKGRIKRHIIPKLGSMRVGSITSADIVKFQFAITSGATRGDFKTKPRGVSRVRGGAGTASRTLGLLGGICTFAQRMKLRTDNPVHEVKRAPDKKCERFLTNAELQGLAEYLEDSENDISVHTVPALRLLMLTGCRKSEILSLKWSDIDVERQFILLSDSKTGARKVPLNDEALLVLNSLTRNSRSDFLFPNSIGTGYFSGLQKDWARIRSRCGIDDVRIHDLRHTFATALAKEGMSLLVIGKLLGHRDTRTTEIYAHLVDETLHAASRAAGASISSAWRGEHPEQRTRRP